MGWWIVAVMMLGAGFSLATGADAADRPPVRALSKTFSMLQGGASRSCTADDLLGNWRLVGFDSPYQFRDPHAPYLLPYQVFQYSNNGGVKSAHSIKPIPGETDAVFDAIPLGMSYRVQLGGIVTLSKQGHDGPVETWRCMTLAEDRIDGRRQMTFQRGDLLMTLTGRQGQTLFVRHLRRVSS